MTKLGTCIIKMFPSIRWAFNWKEWNPSENDFLYATSCIQLEEKERLAKFVFRKDIRASLVGRLMMRKFVNEYTGIPFNKILFTRDDHNKPILKNSPVSVSFNVSHQGDYTVLAGEVKDMKLGIDIMKLEYSGGKTLSEYFRLMNRNFSLLEWKEIKGVPSTTECEQIAMFCRHWALKESYVKALGIGIATDLRTIDFRTNSKLVSDLVTTDTILFVNGIKQNWLFQESLIDPNHCIAVALQENGQAPLLQNTLFEKIDFDKLTIHAIPLLSQDPKYTKSYFAKNEKP